MVELKHRLCAILSENFGASAEELNDGARFEDLGLDSLALVEFSIVIRREFGVEVDEDELHPEQTLDDAAGLLVGKGVPA
ncbi:MAG TPA: acyl carrier protein [Pseudonocardiaceae bacterium]|jgi:acyl carrier protein|nr:acyl carrier protein [Pseudonocardiaceae bacterium]